MPLLGRLRRIIRSNTGRYLWFEEAGSFSRLSEPTFNSTVLNWDVASIR